MPRGTKDEIGTRRRRQNGYWETKTKDGWKFDHWIVAEKKLKRPLERGVEMVRLIDGDKDNLSPDNIEIATIRGTSEKQRLRSRLTQLEDDILALKAMPERVREMVEDIVQRLDDVREEIESASSDLD